MDRDGRRLDHRVRRSLSLAAGMMQPYPRVQRSPNEDPRLSTDFGYHVAAEAAQIARLYAVTFRNVIPVAISPSHHETPRGTEPLAPRRSNLRSRPCHLARSRTARGLAVDTARRARASRTQ